MSGYHELNERCEDALWRAGLAAVLAEVLRTLSSPTPEMLKAAFGDAAPSDEGLAAAKADFVAMINASPLAQS